MDVKAPLAIGAVLVVVGLLACIAALFSFNTALGGSFAVLAGLFILRKQTHGKA
jgi:hypothetical protein